ncbi:MAG: hypothetical protein A3D49_01040 [Candidatus Zambryskibacteria bacterium RIFCSPHIGHO2_02_FULL_43_37]|uniref:JAB domain-containing protein n=1 Tax=Candidatus Zambryskibacteria bacterium RIFCSPHIGHO2_02_FULL_43_37 TaxID=1802749 RepID=A0A1G2TGN8_9BACT|nr:MAG: hypothetical protein A2723_01860 [Candidatus Zambryskibacteria bacterium RIFCSPHIGHO2_01_FULL_52_18]OHA96457.1 MAG: hypothetical protein A3D49_01040 [Candidatus Zambryskibacteria bacterium RIFCSPHIGHO2_02_FULL_43_37]OHB07241.1 MAG: hypothetical protein A2944_01600 [Candidatus Zambryskibacteria bacterium RIFCSPLOWO2_01_FULL_52_12]
MRISSVLVVTVLAAGCALHQSPRPGPREAVIGYEVSKNLDFFYLHMNSEFAFCMHGKVKRGTVYVDRLSVPLITEATSTSVRLKMPLTCPQKDLLGVIHSHPGDAWERCDFSGNDLNDFWHATFLPFDFLYCPDKSVEWNDRYRVNDWHDRSVRAGLIKADNVTAKKK